MTIATQEQGTDDIPAAAVQRARDAANTRQLLLEAARRRFALDGYTSTTVRDIATDAGVNVSLINRYFVSKEGLFEACLSNVAAELDRPDDELTLDRIVRRVVEQVATTPDGDNPLQLLLLLRTSGDERADLIRRNTLRDFAERIAVVSGWRPGDADADGDGDAGDEMLIRAEIAICTGLGIALVRASSGLEPLTSATSEQLTAPLHDVFSALLDR